MHERPIGDLVDALRRLGCTIDDLGGAGYPPLRLRGEAGGALRLDAPIRVRGDVSSQFLSALLLALPLVSGEARLVVEVEGELISRPYVEITLRLLERFGVAVEREGWQRFVVAPRSAYRSPGSLHVEGDASAASYFVALGAIAAHGGRSLRIEGVGTDSIQGDIRFVDAARAMGAHVEAGPGWLEVRRGMPGAGWPLAAIDLDCNHIPDAAMTLAVMALYARGTTRLTNIASWRVKETDRIAAMAAELRKLGATVVEHDDAIEVSPPARWRAAAIDTYDDHRMAMCFSLAAFNGPGRRRAGPAGAHQRPALRRQDLPRLLRDAVRRRRGRRPTPSRCSPSTGRPPRARARWPAQLARALGYHLLDSGALYRATAVMARRAGVADDDAEALAALAARPAARVRRRPRAAGRRRRHRRAARARRSACAPRASRPGRRCARRCAGGSSHFRRLPGLVADGRDMGSVDLPRRRAQGVPHRERRAGAPSAGISS